MTLNEAVTTYKAMQAKQDTSYEALNDASKHQLIHDILRVVSRAIAAHEITYTDFERMVSL